MKYLLLFPILFHFLIVSCGQSEAQENLDYYCPPCNRACDKLAFDTLGECPHCGMELIQQTKDERTISMKSDRIKIAFYLQDGVEVLDFAGPMEVFSYAHFEVFTVSKTKEPIISQGILTIVPDYSLADAPEADIMAFFGGGNAFRASQDRELMAWIKERAPSTDFHFSVCTGAFMLGRAGLLDGLTVTTYHKAIEGLQEAVPKAKVLSDVRFVDNGKVITTAGISAGIDGALHLVAKLKGMDEARHVAKEIEYDKWVPKEGLILNAAK